MPLLRVLTTDLCLSTLISLIVSDFLVVVTLLRAFSSFKDLCVT
jgi:hypothetical protein